MFYSTSLDFQAFLTLTHDTIPKKVSNGGRELSLAYTSRSLILE